MVLRSVVLRDWKSNVMGIAYALHAPYLNMLRAIPNQVDYQRRTKIGPEHSCAEWLLRTGAHIRWRGSGMKVFDYNLLPSVQAANAGLDNVLTGVDNVIEEVVCDESNFAISGFQHFDGCQGIKKMTFIRCDAFTDSALPEIARYIKIRNSLEELRIVDCNVTLRTVCVAKLFQNLKKLQLEQIPVTESKVKDVFKDRPDCEVICRDVLT